MFKDDALVNLLLVYPVRWSEGPFRPLVQIDQLEISKSMNPSAEIQGTAVPPKDSRTFKCNSLDSNFISNHRCFISFPQIGIFVRGAVIAEVISRFGQRFSIRVMNHFNFISSTLIGWNGAPVSFIFTSKLETSFLAQSFTFRNSESNDSWKLNILIFNKQIRKILELSIDRITAGSLLE